MALPEGTALKNGRYQIEKLLAYGGFGFTYLARDQLAQRTVVLKELIPALADHTDAARRFVREGRTMQRLRHPHIARTEAMFRDRGNHYMVIEYVPGVPLSDWTDREQRMSLSQTAPLILALCDALSYLHQRGIVHCDLNASNVLLDKQGQPKLVDLGIAHVSDDFVHRAWQTQRSFAVGTILCMAPEQLDGARADPRVDLYALATLLYQLLAGRPYLDFDSRHTPSAQAENIHRVRTELPRAISGVPPAVMSVVLVALAKDPNDRFADVETFRRELTQALLAHVPSHRGIELLAPAATGQEASGSAQERAQENAQDKVRYAQPFEWPPWIWGVLVAINVVVMALVGFLLMM